MKFIERGNFEKAYQELKSNQNNAVAFVFDEQNSKQGPLSNVIFTLKNNYAKLISTTDASSNLLTNFTPGYNATILELLLESGASLVATTNLDEFGMGGTGQFSNHGLIVHPKNEKHLVGGSSSGAAATFSLNIGFAIGSDTGDSVRLPASNIGVVGFKPSYGAVSRYGLFAYASSMDTVAWFSHNVNDSYIVAQTLFKQDPKDLTSVQINLAPEIKAQKPLKVAYLDCFDYVEEYVAKAYQQLLDKLKSENVELVKINPNVQLLESVKTVYDVISFSEATSNLSNLTGVGFGQRKEGQNWEEIFKQTRSDGFGFMVQRRLALGSFFLQKENQEKFFLRAQKVRRLIYNWFNQIYDKYDFLIFPSSQSIAPLKENDQSPKNFMNYILTSSNLVGNPSINLKLGEHQGLPFNISIDSKIYQDEKLFSCALYIEQLLGDKND